MSLSSAPAVELGSDHGFAGFGVWPSCSRCFSRLRRELLSSCVAKKKVAKEEGDPGRRRAAPLKQSSPFIRPNLRCSASHKGPERRRGTTGSVVFQAWCSGSGLCAWRFSASRRQRRATEALAEKGRGLFEGRSPEFRSPRQRRVAQGTRAAGADAGSPFLCGLSFGEAKESPARLKREKQRLHERQTHKPWPDPGLQTPTRASCSRLDG